MRTKHSKGSVPEKAERTRRGGRVARKTREEQEKKTLLLLGRDYRRRTRQEGREPIQASWHCSKID